MDKLQFGNQAAIHKRRHEDRKAAIIEHMEALSVLLYVPDVNPRMMGYNAAAILPGEEWYPQLERHIDALLHKIR